MEPDINNPVLQEFISAGNKVVPFVRPDKGLLVLAYMARYYLQHPPPAQFHFLASPMVTWIWLGGLIVFGGGLIAMWPAPGTVRRRAAVRSAARVARGLARA